MNFFEHQAQAKSQTSKLIVLLLLAVFSLIVITNIVVMLIFGYLTLGEQPLTWQFIQQQFNWKVFFSIGAAVFLVVLVSSVYKLSELSSGGKVIAEGLGGTRIDRSTDNFQYKTLLNVVEEMAIASGTPVLPVYVLKDESGINAFAAGYSIKDAVIGVTQGALEYFDRDELQGVIAHEFSHILHGDMRINMRLVGILHGILMMGIIGYHILDATRYRSSRSKQGNQIALLGFALVIIGYSGTFFGKIIKASISRQREYLADASAVQFTRNNRGIANALKKVGGHSMHGQVQIAEAREYSHAFFANAMVSKWQGWFATHPPLKDRVKRIEPTFRGEFPVVLPLPNVDNTLADSEKEEQEVKKQEQKQQVMTGVMAGVIGNAPASASPVVLSASIGELDSIHIEHAQELIANIPDQVKLPLYSTESAMSAMYVLFLSKDTDVHQHQLDYLGSSLAPTQFSDVLEFKIHYQNLDRPLRLPLLEIALPNLTNMSRISYIRFKRIIDALIMADKRTDITEWSLRSILMQHLSVAFGETTHALMKYKAYKPVKPELNMFVAQLLDNFVPEHEHDQLISDINAKFGLEIMAIPPYYVGDAERLDVVIERLNGLAPKLKEQVVKLSIYILTQDKDFSFEEQETVRAIVESLGCPMPLMRSQ